MKIKTYSGYEVELKRTPHPTQPQLETYCNAELHLWLVAHDGRWTFFPEGLGMASGPTPEQAFHHMFNVLQAEVTGPYTLDETRQRAAELLGDFA